MGSIISLKLTRIAGRPIVYVDAHKEPTWMERSIIAYPEPNLTCYSLLSSGMSRHKLQREAYTLHRQDGTDGLYVVELSLTENMMTYDCDLSNVFGKSTVEFLIKTYTTEDYTISYEASRDGGRVSDNGGSENDERTSSYLQDEPDPDRGKSYCYLVI